MKNIATKLFFAFFLIAISIVLLSTFKIQQKLNFSGTWNIDISKSEFDSIKPDIAPKQIVANQTLSSIVINKTFEHPGSASNSYAQTFTYDGKPSERLIGRVERRVTTISTSKDTLIFSTHSYIDNKGFKWEYTAKEKWNLAADEKSLTIRRIAVLPDRTEVYMAVYDKK